MKRTIFPNYFEKKDGFLLKKNDFIKHTFLKAMILLNNRSARKRTKEIGIMNDNVESEQNQMGRQ